MKSFGQAVKEARHQKGFSIDDLAEVTKIKRHFLLAIEGQKWDKLPDFPVLAGFVRSISHALDVNEYKLVAFLKRDYPPKTLRVNPKPDVESKILWGPKHTFFAGVLVVILLVAGYLVYQYARFISPPSLILDFPPEGYVAKEAIIKVTGITSQDATVKINNQPFVVDPEGKFEGEIEITKSTQEINARATSRTGRETLVVRKISTDF